MFKKTNESKFKGFTPPPGIEPGRPKGLGLVTNSLRVRSKSFALKPSAIPLCDGGLKSKILA